jgi:hypothetical protein
MTYLETSHALSIDDCRLTIDDCKNLDGSPIVNRQSESGTHSKEARSKITLAGSTAGPSAPAAEEDRFSTRIRYLVMVR